MHVPVPHLPSPQPLFPDALSSRCAEALCDLTDTQQGIGKEWKNVQPCVARTSQLLLQQAQGHEERLVLLEAKMNQVFEAVEVIANDCRLKEQRYRMDCDATERALEQLGQTSQRLHEALGAERRATQQFHEEVLYPSLSGLQRQIDRLMPGVPISASPELPEGAIVDNMLGDGRRKGGDDSMVKEIMREVKLLRIQWQQLLQTHSFAIQAVPRHGEQRPSTVAKGVKAFPKSHPWMDCGVARWQWNGGHVSAPMLSPDSAIPWSALHLRKVATGDWLPFDSTPDTLEALPFIWRPLRPSTVELVKGGIYRVTVCLISSCNRSVSRGGGRNIMASASPSVTLRINNNTVFSFVSRGSTCYTLRSTAEASRPPASAGHVSGKRAPANSRVCTCSRRPCDCGAFPAFSTSTFSDYLRLPEGSTVAVHCHNVPDTNARHEALLEVELIAR